MKIQNSPNIFFAPTSKKVLNKVRENFHETNIIKPSNLSFGNNYYDSFDEKPRIFLDLFADCKTTLDVRNALLEFGTYKSLPFASKLPKDKKAEWTLSLDEINEIYTACSQIAARFETDVIENKIRKCEKDIKFLFSQIKTSKNIKETVRQ